MDASSKLRLLATQMHLESAEDAHSDRIPLDLVPQHRSSKVVQPCGQVAGGQLSQAKQDSLGITQAVMPGGKRINLLKTLLTSACERNCFYCPFRAGRNYRRATFKPEEMAQTFMDMYRAGMVEGLFLSSGIVGGGVRTQDKLIDTVEILRRKLDFRGYVHLKIMPGAEKEQVVRSMQLSSRVSVNLEGANTTRLRMLAPKKVFFEELLQPLKWVEEIRRNQLPDGSWNGRWPSSTTQFVVGAVGESDLELLTTVNYLYKVARLSRTYFMAFNPVPETPFEDREPEDPWRQHRLYQASYLLRDYGFDLEDLPFQQIGNLPREIDPKLAWARVNLSQEPVEVNKANRITLLKVPGIGHKGANAILSARRKGTLRQLSDLKAIGVNPNRPAPYVLLDGRRPPHQLRLF